MLAIWVGVGAAKVRQAPDPPFYSELAMLRRKPMSGRPRQLFGWVDHALVDGAIRKAEDLGPGRFYT